MVKQKKQKKKTELLKLDHHFPSGSWGYSLEKHVLLGIRPAMLVLLILQRQIRNGIVTIIFFFSQRRSVEDSSHKSNGP